MNLKLIRPTLQHKNQYEEYKSEFINNGESFVDDSSTESEESYNEWLERITDDTNPNTVSKDWVLTDTYFVVRDNDRKLIGLCELRHSEEDIIKDFGQIAYEVRPSERRKGYATEIVSMLCNKAKDSGMKELYISVEKSNISSNKVILNNHFSYIKSFDYLGQTIDVYKKNLQIFNPEDYILQDL